MFNQQHQIIDNFTNMRARGLITFHCQFCRRKHLPGVGTGMTGDVFLAFTQSNAGCCNSTNSDRNRTHRLSRTKMSTEPCSRKYIDTIKYDIAEEEIQFLISSKPLQTRNRCLPTHIAIYNHFASLFINSKFKIAMYTVMAIQSWLFSGALRSRSD